MPPLRFAAAFCRGGIYPSLGCRKTPGLDGRPGRRYGFLVSAVSPVPRKRYPRRKIPAGCFWICQAIRTADTTRRPLPPPWVYSQVDRVMSLSPYLGVMPVS